MSYWSTTLRGPSAGAARLVYFYDFVGYLHDYDIGRAWSFAVIYVHRLEEKVRLWVNTSWNSKNHFGMPWIFINGISTQFISTPFQVAGGLVPALLQQAPQEQDDVRVVWFFHRRPQKHVLRIQCVWSAVRMWKSCDCSTYIQRV